MSMFDKYKLLHGFPKEGQKIRFLRETPSWFINVQEDSKLLEIGKEYTVRKTQLNSSSSYVWLKEFPNIFDDNDTSDGRDQPFFNLASFSWDKPEINMDDLVGYSLSDLLTLNHTYGWGILDYEGYPTLMTDCDENEIVKEAWLVL